MKPWQPGEPSQQKHKQQKQMTAPICSTEDRSKFKYTDSLHRIIIYSWLTLVTVIVTWTFFRYTPYTITTPTIPPAVAETDLKRIPKDWKDKKRGFSHVYPFNIYDDAQNRIVRYPQTGGIPHLVWKDVKYFRACCRDENFLRCFATDELALRRDAERTQKGLPDVYMEISQHHADAAASASKYGKADWKPIGTKGSRCHLVWTSEKAKIES